MIKTAAALAVSGFARAVTGVRGHWVGCPISSEPRVYFANHASHGDFVLIWCALPPALRRKTRPVAGADYWQKNAPRRFFGERVFNAVLIERDAALRREDPIAQMATALDPGSSLILFPEGTRNTTDQKLLPFRSGLYRLARARPHIPLVPVWIENINRVMPKGEFVPVPLLCTVSFGEPLQVGEAEDKASFLERARNAMLALSLPRETLT